jgi:hypothetical protein
MKRSAVAVLAVLTAALLVAGCGGGSNGGSNSTAPESAPKQATSPNAPAGSRVTSCGEATQLRATAVSCETARAMVGAWEQSQGCVPTVGASRSSCSLGRFRCQAVQVDHGISVSCAGPAGDVAFLVKPAG